MMMCMHAMRQLCIPPVLLRVRSPVQFITPVCVLLSIYPQAGANSNLYTSTQHPTS
jgi:hypothetical protein